MMRCFWAVLLILAAALCGAAGTAGGFIPLFPENGPPRGWRVGEWYDVGVPVTGARWVVEEGVLRSGGRVGTWLLSEKEYSDFILEFEIKMTADGNSGIALRAPAHGDPAFDGLELQFMDVRYSPTARDAQLTGSLYAALPPLKQVYRPTDWNRCRIEMRGPRLQVVLNGETVQRVNLDEQREPRKRHNGSAAPSLKDRPRRGRIGFQHGGGEVWVRNARIRELQQKR